MIITALAEWQTAAGTLLEWHATAKSTAAAAAAPATGGKASFLQDNHIRGVAAKAAAGQPHHAYLAVGTEVDGELDVPAMTRALRRFVCRHGGLRSWFDTATPAVSRKLIAQESVEFEARFVGESAGHTHFLEYVLARFAREAIATSWPGFAFGAVTRPGGFTLYYGCDHALSDGASQALVLSEILEFYAEEAFGTPIGPYTAMECGSFTDYTEIEHALAASVRQDSPEIGEWLDLFGRHGSAMPSFPMDLGLAPGATAPMRAIEFDLLDHVGTRAFDAVCKSNGARYVAGVLAAVAITDYEVGGRDEYYGMTVLSTRDLGDFLVSQGWFCQFAPVSFPVHTSASFTELLAHAHAGYQRAMRLGAVPVQSVIAALLASGAHIDAVTASPNMLSYIDFRRFPGAGTPAYERAVLCTGEGSTANASMWFNRDERHLYVGCQSPDTPLARRNLATYHAHLRAVFDSIARDGDYRIRAGADKEVAGASHHH
ncbi:condensation domain-containing protein [Nocardia callitridis]|uniref:Condensation domain-containing protein n=1 Tax=Nocardia callitridis TaxID=648753 RepID=A0ABP9KKQ2_9NOCA